MNEEQPDAARVVAHPAEATVTAFDEGPFTATLESFSPSPLAVNVDWLQLLEYHNGDEAAAFQQLANLKDLLA